VKRCSALLTCLLLLVVSKGVVHAASEPECSGQKPWVLLEARTSTSLAARVGSDLRAGLAPSSIDVCSGPPAGGPEPLAHVVIEQVDDSTARFSLDVTDSVTRKRVGRDLALDKLPADGRALALAVAAEELLRASWAELALRGVHIPETAAPPEVRAVVERAEPRPAPLRRFVAPGARVAFEHFLGGQTHYGGDLFLVLPLGSVASGLLSVGARRALSVQAPHGSIGASAFSGELGLSLALYRQGGLDLSAFASGRMLRLTFEPEGEPGVTSTTSSGFVIGSRAGLGLAFGSAGLLRSYTALGAGLPLRSFEASDSGGVVTGASKLELFASTGLALEFP
jgi:hypothetical protein